MPRKSASSSPQLNFHTFESGFHYAHGLLTDHMGNTFHIEVKGKDANHVKRHMRYLVRKTKAGQGITTEFRPLTPDEQTTQRESQAVQSDTTKTKRHWSKPSLKDLILTIEPLKLNKKTNEPHRLSINIDPPLSNKPGDNIPSSYTTTILHKTKVEAIDVGCTVTQGKRVVFELFQTDSDKSPAKASVSRKIATVQTRKPLVFKGIFPAPETAYTEVNWYAQVSLPPNDVQAYFTLSLDFNVP